MLQHVEQLKDCTDLTSLKIFVQQYAPNKSSYDINFRKGIQASTDFNKALQKVWNYALQQEGKYFLGREGYIKVKCGAIAGMECHSEGHR